VLSVSTFFNKGQRAELFELLDNEVPTVKIYMTDDEFIDLKDRATNYLKTDFSDTLNSMSDIVKNYLLELQKINFKEVYPGNDFNTILPSLQVGKDGHAKYDVEEIISGFDYDSSQYDDGSLDSFIKHFLKSNKNFNLTEIIDTLKKMKMSDTEKKDKKVKALITNANKYFKDSIEKSETDEDPLKETLSELSMSVKIFLETYKTTNFTEDYPGNHFSEDIPQLKIGEDGYAKFDINEVYKGFDFDPKNYDKDIFEKVEYDEFSKMVYESNKNFNLYEIMKVLEDSDNANLKRKRSTVSSFKSNKMLSMDFNSASKSFGENIFSNGDDEENEFFREFKTKNATMTFEFNG